MPGFRYTVAHPTDYSGESSAAFMHALKLALLLRAEFHLLHVRDGSHSPSGHDHFPAVRETLARWGLIAADAPREAVDRDLGVLVYKVDIRDHGAAEGVQHFVRQHGAELVVLATHGRDGLDRLVHGSVSEDIAAMTDVPALFVPTGSRGFVDPATGALTVPRIVVPVATTPDPGPALRTLADLLERLQIREAQVDFIHVGAEAPVVRLGEEQSPLPVRTVQGRVVEAILAAAQDADLIVMATEKRNSVLDTLRGTTTERVIRQAPCPVLAIPA